MNYRSFNLMLTPCVALILSACGGGDSSSSNDQNTVNIQPRQVETSDWDNTNLIQARSVMENSVEVIGSKLHINITSDDIVNGEHLQIYINSDNKAQTGFQFEGQAWEDSGVDYLIEDGNFFKSTANNTGWNWDVNAGSIDYAVNSNNATAEIDLSLLGNICNNLKIGVMTRDASWSISTFAPASSQMQTYNVSYCNTDEVDNIKPVITLQGANPLYLNINQEYSEPGVTASDNFDGDITNSIDTKSTINSLVAGSYEVTYSVSDAAGNSTSAIRTVIVSEEAQSGGIVVDGNSSDWNSVATFSSTANAIMKVTDDEEKLYILVTANNLGENIQVMMDTDNNFNTGLDLSAHVNTWLAGADYMIENNSLDKSQSNTLWSWDYGVSPIEYFKTSNTLEIAIKKSDFEKLANQIPMGFVSRTASWNVNYVLPEQSLPTYTLLFSAPTIPLVANDDSASTEQNEAITVNVLGNDISNSGSGQLTVSNVSSPNNGIVRIVNNQVIYIPFDGFVGTDVFSYTTTNSDGLTDTATITITVTAASNNDPVAIDDTVTIVGLNTAQISVLENDTDADGETIQIIGFSQPFNGSISLTTASATFNYTPNDTFFGTDQFTYTIGDGNGGSDTATVTVEVKQNIPPIANDDFATTDGINTIRIFVEANDVDPDGNGAGVGLNNDYTQPLNGTVARNTPRTLDYTPNPTFSGTDTFTYSITDINGATATATVFVTVPENNSPDAVEDVAGVFFNQTTTINVLSNDTDPDGDVLTVESIVQPPVGFAVLNENGTIFFNPQNTVGSISIGYTVSDGRGGTDFAVLTVSSTDPNDGNDAFPDISNEQITISANTSVFIDVLANDFDADGDVLVLDQVDQGQNGTTIKVTQNGVLGVLYTPNPGFTGSDIFYYGVHDGFGHNGSGFVDITVNP